MSDETPTVMLVHGAFADASSWNGVVELLQSKGVTVAAPANPLRGIALDSAYIAGVLDETPPSRQASPSTWAVRELPHPDEANRVAELLHASPW